MSLHESIVPSFLLLNSIQGMYISQFGYIRSTVNKRLGCFQFRVIMDNSAMRVSVQVFLRICVFIYPG